MAIGTFSDAVNSKSIRQFIAGAMPTTLDAACYAAELGEVHDAREQLWLGQAKQRSVQEEPEDRDPVENGRNSPSKRDPTKVTPWCNSPHKEDELVKALNKLVAKLDPGNRKDAQQGGASRFRSRAPGKGKPCFQCGQDGHWAAQCPKREKDTGTRRPSTAQQRGMTSNDGDNPNPGSRDEAGPSDAENIMTNRAVPAIAPLGHSDLETSDSGTTEEQGEANFMAYFKAKYGDISPAPLSSSASSCSGGLKAEDDPLAMMAVMAPTPPSLFTRGFSAIRRQRRTASGRHQIRRSCHFGRCPPQRLSREGTSPWRRSSWRRN